jgi:hypothetical protein
MSSAGQIHRQVDVAAGRHGDLVEEAAKPAGAAQAGA